MNKYTFHQRNNFTKQKIHVVGVLLAALLVVGHVYIARAQPALPPRTLTVTPTQGLHFGTFTTSSGTGGTVVVDWSGSRQSTGGIILLATAPFAQPAVFEIKICQGRNVVITFAPETILSGSHGGTLHLQLGPTEQGGNNSLFYSNADCNFITPMSVGGTLQVPPNPVPGIYSGFFEITLNQE